MAKESLSKEIERLQAQVDAMRGASLPTMASVEALQNATSKLYSAKARQSTDTRQELQYLKASREAAEQAVRAGRNRFADEMATLQEERRKDSGVREKISNLQPKRH